MRGTEIDFGIQTAVGKPPWPRRAILAFTRMELGILREMRTGGREGRPLMEGLTQVRFWPDLVLAGPMLGAPQAAMVMETLGRRGVREFLSLGWCGSLQPGLGWGRVILPLSAFCEEGTSAHYRLEGPPAGADPRLSGRLAESLRARGVDFTSGRVWTTDAPFRETREKVREYGNQGLLAVDMETSALMSVARFRDWSWAGLLVVSDELWGERWRPGFQSPELKAGLVSAAEVLTDVFGGWEVE
ncbi:MAG: nucleoside phosphorylase [Thermodesulfobacteriota bacterium]